MIPSILHGALTASLIASALSACTTDNESFTASNDQALYVDSTTFWPSRLVPVCWEASGNDTQKGYVKDAVARSWSTIINMQFTGWNTCGATSPGIRIRLADERPRSFYGTQLDGRRGGMTLNFTFQYRDENNKQPFAVCIGDEANCIKSIAVHEFGNALGCRHEQELVDDPSTCTQEGYRTAQGDTTFGDWDPNSIMNYCNLRWNNGGTLSANDIKGAQFMYPSYPHLGVGNTD